MRRYLRFYFFLIFAFFSQNVIAAERFINIYIISVADTDESLLRQIATEYHNGLIGTAPFSEYADRIMIRSKRLPRAIVTIDKYDQPVYMQDDIRQCHSPSSSLDIYILNDAPLYAKGGKVAGLPVIFAGTDITSAELMHETCHAIAGLGDEYDSGMDLTFSERYVSRYPNLTLTYPVPEWERIKRSHPSSAMLDYDLIGYYPGGLGSSSGIYHSYPRCLMNSLGDPLCPICEYYVRQSLSQILQ